MRLVCDPDESIADRWSARFERIQPTSDLPLDDFYLQFREDRLRLCRGSDRRGICASSRDIERRLGGDFLLGRACTAGSRSQLRVLDAMAGLGIDGIALAMRGHRVTLVERDVVLWALLDDLLRCLGLTNVDLHLGDCREVLDAQASSSEPFDVVYLDPMFPQRSKRALPGKSMQYVSALLEKSVDEPVSLTQLINQARARVVSHVVLKRRRKDPEIEPPDWQIKGRTVRYDMFRALKK